MQMFGKTVLGIDGDRFEERLDQAKQAKGVESDVDLDVDDLRELVVEFKQVVRNESGPGLPAGPARAARPRRARGVRLVEHGAGQALPPAGAHP